MINFVSKIYFTSIISVRATPFWEKGRIRIRTSDPNGPKTCGSCGSGSHWLAEKRENFKKIFIVTGKVWYPSYMYRYPCLFPGIWKSMLIHWYLKVYAHSLAFESLSINDLISTLNPVGYKKDPLYVFLHKKEQDSPLRVVSPTFKTMHVCTVNK